MHNCRIGRTYFIYPMYCTNVASQIKGLSERERERNIEFIKHLIISGKINELVCGKMNWEINNDKTELE